MNSTKNVKRIEMRKELFNGICKSQYKKNISKIKEIFTNLKEKANYVIFGICFLFLPIIFLGCGKDNGPYPNGGRDTYEQFGDRRFVILTGINPIDNMTKTYCLYDQKDELEGQVEGNIINYVKISPYIYTIGTNGTGPFYEEEISDSEKIYYTKVNYETGDIIQDTDLNIFSDEDKKIFDNLSNSESPFSKIS